MMTDNFQVCHKMLHLEISQIDNRLNCNQLQQFSISRCAAWNQATPSKRCHERGNGPAVAISPLPLEPVLNFSKNSFMAFPGIIFLNSFSQIALLSFSIIQKNSL